MNLAEVTKKGKYRELFTDHFENSRKETSCWKPQIDSYIEKEGRNISKFRDVVEFIDLNMQTAMENTYNYGKSLDENFQEYKDQKFMQDESDQVNFLRQPASGQAVDEAFEQSVFWYNQKRGFGNGAKAWMPGKYTADTVMGAQKKKPDIPKQER